MRGREQGPRNSTGGAILQVMPDKDRPPTERDCLDCGRKNGMKLTNTLGTQPTNIPLLYVCAVCGCNFTVPPPHSPLLGIKPRDT